MVVTQKKHLLSISMITLLLTSQITHTKWSDETLLGGALLVVGGTIAAGIGLGVAYGWFETSNETIINNAHDTLAQAQKQHQDLMFCFENVHVQIPTKLRTQAGTIQSVDEDTLLRLAQCKFQNGHSLIYSLSESVRHLNDTHKTLNERIRKLRAKGSDHADKQQCTEMQELVVKIDEFLPKIEFLHEFFVYHKDYFTLYETEISLREYYDHELHIATHYTTDISMASRFLKGAVMARPVKKYPYKNFVETIEWDVRNLQDALKHTSSRYFTRVSSSTNLYNLLIFIKGIVASDPAYSAELIAYQKELIAREKLALKEKQLALQAAQTAAVAKQAREMQEYNKLKEEELRLLKKEQRQKAGFFSNFFYEEPKIDVTIRLES